MQAEATEDVVALADEVEEIEDGEVSADGVEAVTVVDGVGEGHREVGSRE